MLKFGFKNLITFCLFFSSFLLLLNVNTAFAATVSLSWNPPTANTDGSQLTDLAGYKVYYGTISGYYTQQIDVSNGTTTYTLPMQLFILTSTLKKAR